MADFNFDLYAMIHPKTQEDMIALVQEALTEIRSVNSKLALLLGTEQESVQHV